MTGGEWEWQKIMNPIVFDIETKNAFSDVGGKDNLRQLDVSVVGVYSYADDAYRIYDEGELAELGAVLRYAKPLIGFFSTGFDVPVLEKYFDFPLAAVPHFDIFNEVYGRIGRRIGLGALAEANLGEGKNGKGMDAIVMYREGRIDELKKYCLQDVKVTKGLFDLIRKQGYLWVPQRNVPQMEKITVVYEEPEAERQHALL